MASLEICKFLVFGHKRQTRYDMIEINKELLDSLFVQAESSDRKRINHDLRTSLNDGGQRMLNAMLRSTIVPIHRHPMSNENVILLVGKMDEVF